MPVRSDQFPAQGRERFNVFHDAYIATYKSNKAVQPTGHRLYFRHWLTSTSDKIAVYTVRDIIYNDLMNRDRITSFRLKLYTFIPTEKEREREKKSISPFIRG